MIDREWNRQQVRFPRSSLGVQVREGGDGVVDGPLLRWDADDPTLLHLYLLSYERHALLNHFVLSIPPDVRSDSEAGRE